MNSQWTTWILIVATVAWLLLLRWLDLLLVVAPAAAVLSYATARLRKSRQNRM
jgi:hypothetical protein